MSLTFFHQVAQEALAQLTEPTRFTDADAQLIGKHADELLAITSQLVSSFYDGLFANAQTRAVFREGERPAREETLTKWWRRTILGPVNEEYWAWQAYVGLIHVKRKVTNTMVLGQIFFINSFLKNQTQLPAAVLGALERLLASVAAVIAHGYDTFYVKSVEKMTGFSKELVGRQVALGIEEVLAEYRRSS